MCQAGALNLAAEECDDEEACPGCLDAHLALIWLIGLREREIKERMEAPGRDRERRTCTLLYVYMFYVPFIIKRHVHVQPVPASSSSPDFVCMFLTVARLREFAY